MGTVRGGGGGVQLPTLTSVIIHPRSELDHGTAPWISPGSAVTKRQRDSRREPWPRERIGSLLSLRLKMEGRMLVNVPARDAVQPPRLIVRRKLISPVDREVETEPGS